MLLGLGLSLAAGAAAGAVEPARWAQIIAAALPRAEAAGPPWETLETLPGIEWEGRVLPMESPPAPYPRLHAGRLRAGQAVWQVTALGEPDAVAELTFSALEAPPSGPGVIDALTAAGMTLTPLPCGGAGTSGERLFRIAAPDRAPALLHELRPCTDGRCAPAYALLFGADAAVMGPLTGRCR